MASKIVRSEILVIYKLLLRESQKFNNYNFREYSLRRIKDGFKDSKNYKDPKDVKKAMEYAKENLEIVRRQIILGDLYSTERLVIENMH